MIPLSLIPSFSIANEHCGLSLSGLSGDFIFEKAFCHIGDNLL